MTVENTYLLKETFDGFAIIQHSPKQTVLPKKHAPAAFENQVYPILKRNNPSEVVALLFQLIAISQQGGWDKAPIAYFLRHQGWALSPAFGTAGDLQLIIRSNRNLSI